MRTRGRDLGIAAMLVASCVALAATSPAPFEADIADSVAQATALSLDHPTATTSVLFAVSAEALADQGAESRVLITATSEDVDGAAISPALRISVSWGPDDNRQTEPGEDESVEFPLSRICPLVVACDQPVDISIEWLNPSEDSMVPVTLLVEAGIDYSQSPLSNDDDPPAGATLVLEPVAPLQAAEPSHSLRGSTDPETITMSADAPFALRRVTVEVGAEARPADGETADLSAVMTVDGLDGDTAIASVWQDSMVGRPGAEVGTTMPLSCPITGECLVEYTLVLDWTGREPGDVVDVTWSLSARLAYPERAEPPPEDALTFTVEASIDAGPEGGSLTVDAGGTIERTPADPTAEVPTEPRGGEHLIEVVLDIWDADSTNDRGIPATGVVTLTARSADGRPLRGPVQVSVVTYYQAVKSGPPRNEELTPGHDQLSFAITPSFACSIVRVSMDEGRCRLPLDIFVQTPDEATGPVRVDWSITVSAFSADDLRLEPGDLAVEVNQSVER